MIKNFLFIYFFIIGQYIFPCYTYSQSISITSDKSFEYFQKGRQFLKKGKTEQAITYFEQAVFLNPEKIKYKKSLAKAYIKLSNVLCSKTKFSDALKWAKKAYSIYSNEETKDNIALIYKENAIHLLEKNKFKEAAKKIEIALSLSPLNQEIKETELNVKLRYGLSLSSDDRKKIFLKLLKRHPDSDLTMELLGDAYYYEDEDLNNAIKYYTLSVKINPENDTALIKLKKAENDFKNEKNYKKSKYSHFTVKYEGYEKTELAWSVLNILNEAYSSLKNKIGFYSKKKLSVIIYTEEKYKNVTGVEWSAGLYDGKIRVRESDITTGDKINLKNLLYHEYTHALIFERVGNKLPVWVNEGFAQLFEPSIKWNNNIRNYLKDTVDSYEWIPFNSLDQSWNILKTEKQVTQAYMQSFAAAYYITKLGSDYSIVKILDNMNSGESFEKSLKRILGIDLKLFEINFKDFIRK